MAIYGEKVRQTVTPNGVPVSPMVAGVRVHQQPTQQDERGTLFELYSPHWRLDDLPFVYAYGVTIRPGRVKGWALHERHADRYFFVSGSLKLVLYDPREDSPTRGLVSVQYFSEFNRSLVFIPPLVYHAIENVGDPDGFLVSMPSAPYDHANPDKYVLPPNNDLIPYRFQVARPGA